MTNIYKIIDLCAGIGGIRRGFEMSGKFTNVFSAENNKYACMVYEHIYNENAYADITTQTCKKKVESIPYDLLCAGFPCQAFSIAGKKEGFKDRTRGTLFFDIANIIEKTSPKAIFLENVEGLITHKKGQTFKVIIETLSQELNYKIIGVTDYSKNRLSYNPRSFLLNSKDFGVPQNRPRVYIIGFDRTRYGDRVEKIVPGLLPKTSKKEPIYDDLHDLLEYGASPRYYLSQQYWDTLKKHRARHEEKGNGYGYIIVNRPGIKNPISNAILATGGSGKERNLIYDPQEQIIGMRVQNKRTPLNKDCIRIMTPSEWGKLQGFVGYAFMKNGVDMFSLPDNISNSQQYKLFGNSVTIPVIEALADTVYDCLDSLEKTLE